MNRPSAQAPTITLHIDRLVLEGLEPGMEDAFVGALERHLLERFTAAGVPGVPAGGSREVRIPATIRDALPAGDGNDTAESLAASVARVIDQSLRDGGSV